MAMEPRRDDVRVTEPAITSLQNPRVKEAVRLRDRRHRELDGRTLVDGARELLRAIDAGLALDEVFVCPALCESPDCRQLLGRLGRTGARVLEVSAPVLQKLAYGERTEGVVGIARVRARRLQDLDLPADPLVAVLEGVEKPGNLGAVLRSADGAGVSALVAAEARTDLYNPNVIRASLGTVFTVPTAAASTPEAIAWLQVRALRIITARVDAPVVYSEVDLTGPVAIVLGSEAEGLTAAWSIPDVIAVRVPMLGAADSLNVSATAAVLFYEARRQRDARARAALEPSSGMV